MKRIVVCEWYIIRIKITTFMSLETIGRDYTSNIMQRTFGN